MAEGSDWVPFQAQARQGEAVRVAVTPLQNGFEAEVSVPGALTQTVKAGGKPFSRLSIPGAGVSGDLGHPELPAWRRLFEVPANARNVSVTVLAERSAADAKARQAAPHRVYPVQPPVEKLPNAEPPPFAYEASAYAAKRGGRSDSVTLHEVGRLRGRRLFQVTVYPVDYAPAAPAAHAVTVRQQVRFAVRWELDGKAAAWRPARYACPAFDAALAPWLIGTRAQRAKGFTGVPAGYLIVAAPEFAADPNLAALVDWRTQRGLPATLVTTDTTGTTAAAIKDYIENAYSTWPVPPAFVLLVGDTDSIPHWVGGGTGSPATDLNYALADGDEYTTPDLWVGRFSATSADELAHMVDKTLDYEFGAWSTAPGWEKHVSFMASVDNFDVSEGTHNHVISNYLDPAGYTSEKLYQVSYGATTQDVRNALNNGRAQLVYSGHGGPTSWADGPPFSQDDIRNATNDVYPLVFSFACVTGQFTYGECFGETWLRTAQGGIGFWGSSANSYWDEDDILEKELFEGMYSAGQVWAGAGMAYGKQGLLAYYGDTGTVQRYFEMYNLMGCPAVNLYTEEAGDLSVSHSGAVAEGMPTFTVSGAPAGSIVTLTQDGLLHGVALSSGGTIVVPLEPAFSAGDVTLTVACHNYLPYQAVLPVSEGSDGIVALGRGAYTCGESVSVILTDSDLEGAGTQHVAVDTQSGDSETLTLSETAASGVFEGSMDIACAGARGTEDGALDVIHGDVITVTYEDLDDGTGNPATKTDTADVDTQPPLISGILISDVNSHSATLRLDTDETATVTVAYGLSCAAPFSGTATSENETNHTLILTGLLPGTEYFAQISANDTLGNATTLPECQTFITETRPDYFTEELSQNIDLSGRSITFIPADTADGYVACTESAGGFPAPPGPEASQLPLSDDDTERIPLSDGAQVHLLGAAYSAFFINSNGSVSFGSGSTTYTPSLSAHFGLPRIDVLFTDLNPSSGGAVYFEQLAGRAVVTWDTVPLYNSSSTVSMQVELFFDGRLRLTWLDIQAPLGIAGLSGGGGIPDDFLQSDLSAYPECGAVPEGETPEGEVPEGEMPEGEVCRPWADDAVASVLESGVYAAAESPVFSQAATELDAAFLYQAFTTAEWVDSDVQLFLAAGRTVLATVYAGQPGRCPGILEWWSGQAISLAELEPGLHTLYLVCTTAADAAAGIQAYEQEGGGVRAGLGIIEVYGAEGETPAREPHRADWRDGADWCIDLSELLRVVQLYNLGGFCCAVGGQPSDDGYAAGAGEEACAPHTGDYAPQDWAFQLSELLRVVQHYNAGWYHPCDDPVNGEDGYCPGLPE